MFCIVFSFLIHVQRKQQIEYTLAYANKHTYIVHVLIEQILQRAAHGVALLDDALASVVTRARAVGHERGAADDALQALLQRRARAHLVVARRLHDDLLLQKQHAQNIATSRDAGDVNVTNSNYKYTLQQL